MRQGGDEFRLALTELHEADEVIIIAKKILITVAKPIKIKSHKISTTISIGISIYPKDRQDLSMLIKQADKTLYVVKTEGKNNFRFI
ncbi:MAG: diguanylate cyclase [Gammaproteobacteria bacterium]|nr:diguanylate cyclase [Gammaproteobacteria bacterium]